MMIEVQIIITNQFGEFLGKKVLMTEKQYLSVVDLAKMFYTSGGFELNLIDGSYVVFPPNIVQNSILKIVKNETDIPDELEEIEEEEVKNEEIEEKNGDDI